MAQNQENAKWYVLDKDCGVIVDVDGALIPSPHQQFRIWLTPVTRSYQLQDGCKKQAQGNFDGMCKSHFKARKAEETSFTAMQTQTMEHAFPLLGESVFEKIIPQSIAWNPHMGTLMPLIAHLKAGFDAGKPPAWHRNEERIARGLRPVISPAAQLEPWERELVFTEILILTGNSQTSFRHLARAWGRDKGFQSLISQCVCERRGNFARKMPAICPATVPMPIQAVPRQHINDGEESSVTLSMEEGDHTNNLGDNWEDTLIHQMERNESLMCLPVMDTPAPAPQGQFQSIAFDSTLLAELDRDAEAIISAADSEVEDPLKPHPI